MREWKRVACGLASALALAPPIASRLLAQGVPARGVAPTIAPGALRATVRTLDHPERLLPAMPDSVDGAALPVLAIGPGHVAIAGQHCVGDDGTVARCARPFAVGERYVAQATPNGDAVLAGWASGCAKVEPSCWVIWNAKDVPVAGAVSAKPVAFAAVFRPATAAPPVNLIVDLPPGSTHQLRILPQVAVQCTEIPGARRCRALVPSNWTIDLSVVMKFSLGNMDTITTSSAGGLAPALPSYSSIPIGFVVPSTPPDWVASVSSTPRPTVPARSS